MTAGGIMRGYSASEIAIFVASWIVLIAVLLGLVKVLTFGLRKTVGSADYPALTLVIAALGGLLAYTQANRTTADANNARGRSLGYAMRECDQLMALSQTRTPTDASLHAQAAAIVAGLDELPLSSLPSARSMELVTLERGLSRQLVTELLKGSVPQPIIAQSISLYIDLRTESERLFPVRRIGTKTWGVAIGMPPEWQ